MSVSRNTAALIFQDFIDMDAFFLKGFKYMEKKVSKELHKIYKKSHKNFDMAIMTLLDSFDQEVFLEAFSIINPISLKGDLVTISIGDSTVEQIKDAFKCKEISDNLIGLLLWTAVLFPEI